MSAQYRLLLWLRKAYSEFRTMAKVQGPDDSEFYTDRPVDTEI
jgi:hypothetical protein